MMHKQRLPSNTKQMMNSNETNQLTTDITNAFAESCRLESMKADLHQSQQTQSSKPVNSHHNLYRIGPSISPPSQSTRHMHYGNVMPANVGPNHTKMIENRDDGNLHQKLRRQLSLNPNACDPRIIRMQNSTNVTQHPDHVQHQTQATHRQLAASLSGPRSHMSNHWDLHQVKEIFDFGFGFTLSNLKSKKSCLFVFFF